jgi:hypothetical protein
MALIGRTGHWRCSDQCATAQICSGFERVCRLPHAVSTADPRSRLPPAKSHSVIGTTAAGRTQLASLISVPPARRPHVAHQARVARAHGHTTAAMPLTWLAAVQPAPSPLPDLTPSSSGRGQEALHRTAASQVRALRTESRHQHQRALALRLGCHGRPGVRGHWHLLPASALKLGARKLSLRRVFAVRLESRRLG